MCARRWVKTEALFKARAAERQHARHGAVGLQGSIRGLRGWQRTPVRPAAARRDAKVRRRRTVARGTPSTEHVPLCVAPSAAGRRQDLVEWWVIRTDGAIRGKQVLVVQRLAAGKRAAVCWRYRRCSAVANCGQTRTIGCTAMGCHTHWRERRGGSAEDYNAVGSSDAVVACGLFLRPELLTESTGWRCSFCLPFCVVAACRPLEVPPRRVGTVLLAGIFKPRARNGQR